MLADYDSDKFGAIILVDTTTKNSPVDHCNLTIDHHRTPEDNAVAQIIEPVGATCTLIAEAIRQSEVEFEDDQDMAVATALFFGISNDTDNLVSLTTTDRDYASSRFLIESIDRNKLSKIINYPLPSYFIECEARVLKDENHQFANACYTGFVESVSEKQRDVIPYLADKMARVDGVETSVIFAIVGGKRISCSVRSTNSAIDVDDFCKKLLGKNNAVVSKVLGRIDAVRYS